MTSLPWNPNWALLQVSQPLLGLICVRTALQCQTSGQEPPEGNRGRHNVPLTDGTVLARHGDSQCGVAESKDGDSDGTALSEVKVSWTESADLSSFGASEYGPLSPCLLPGSQVARKLCVRAIPGMHGTNTEASFRQVSSAMSSTLLNFGGFIFWMSSLLTTAFFPFSASSSTTSSPRSSRTLAASKPLRSDGIHTSLLAVQSACAAGL
ncbi:hypothetical protein EYF80_020321 [Liparis tanakae]|uniref:Uncharacterized protein n=1 Tax=Liparis tanakae TaxID=230148 RepID=A0A4Z2HUW6_9TELE|nr:hypothetical protein EYF80_020321 [Liparis tanakae]